MTKIRITQDTVHHGFPVGSIHEIPDNEFGKTVNIQNEKGHWYGVTPSNYEAYTPLEEAIEADTKRRVSELEERLGPLMPTSKEMYEAEHIRAAIPEGDFVGGGIQRTPGGSLSPQEQRAHAKHLESLLTGSYDYVQQPPHYTQGSKEVIDMMIDIWGPEAVAKHCEMCAFKYRMRLGRKPDQPIERDLEKAQWYENKFKELTLHKLPF